MGGKNSTLDEMPFTRKTFGRINRCLRMHGSIVRAINRNTSCTFSTMSYNWVQENSVQPSIGMKCSSIATTANRSKVYNCRTADSWDGDMALSITFFPGTLTTNAVWYGCDLSEHDVHGYSLTDAEIITQKLSNFYGEVFHPMLLPTLFADFERDRLVALVRSSLTQLVQRITELDKSTLQPTAQSRRDLPLPEKSTGKYFTRWPKLSLGNMRAVRKHWDSADSSSASAVSDVDKAPLPTSRIAPKKEESSVILWTKISHLRNGLENWRTQLQKMIEHVEELERTKFATSTAVTAVDRNLSGMRESGNRIRGRLRDLVDEYGEFIRKCTHIMNGMTLATQLVSKRNHELGEGIS